MELAFENQLLPRHLSGDPLAFAELIKAYQAPVYSYLLRCQVPDTHLDDVFQEIFLKIRRAAEQYKPEYPLKPWVFAIVANTVRTFFRKQKVEALVFEQELTEQPGVQEQLEAEETATWFNHMVCKLPMAQREVLLLCGIKEIGPTKAAEILELPIGTVKTHLRRARLALAEAFARREKKLQREVTT